MFTPCSEVKRILAEENGQFIDVRTPEEFAMSQLPGAVNIPLHMLEARAGEIDKDRPVVLFCRSGSRANMAMHMLRAMGYKEVYNMGSFLSWNEC